MHLNMTISAEMCCEVLDFNF